MGDIYNDKGSHSKNGTSLIFILLHGHFIAIIIEFLRMCEKVSDKYPGTKNTFDHHKYPNGVNIRCYPNNYVWLCYMYWLSFRKFVEGGGDV